MKEKSYLLKGIIAIIIVFAILIGQNAVIAEGEEEEEVVEEDATSTVPTLAEIDLGITDDPAGYDESTASKMYDKNGNEQPMYFDWVDNMPRWRSPSGSGKTGTLPEYFANGYERKIKLAKSRTNLDTKEWNAKIEQGILYCQSFGATIKSGAIDTEKRYFTEKPISLGPNGTIDAGAEYAATLQYAMAIEARDDLDDEIESWKRKMYDRETPLYSKIYPYGGEDGEDDDGDESTPPPHIDGSDYEIQGYGPGLVKNALAIFYKRFDYDTADNVDQELDDGTREEAADKAYKATQAILRGVDENKAFKDTDDETIDGTKRQDPDTDTILGIDIGIMETEDGKENHYSVENTLKTFSSDSKEKIEIQKSYILTALEKVYNYENGTWTPTPDKLASLYSLNDIQGAYWLVLNDEDQSETNPFGKNVKDVTISPRLTDGAKELYKKSLEYANFVIDNIGGKYNKQVEIDGKLATFDVKVTNESRSEAEIVSGPYTITYPYYDDAPDISYIKALKITTNTGKTLTYSEEKSEFEIVATTYAPGANGLGEGTKKFPASGTSFYVKFKVQNEECPKAITVKGEFEYLDYSSIRYQLVYSLGHVYRYEIYDGRENYGMTEGYVTVAYTIRGLKWQEDKSQVEKYVWDKDPSGDREYNKQYDSNVGYEREWYAHIDTATEADQTCSGCGAHSKPVYKWAYLPGEDTVRYKYYWCQPFLKMTDKPVSEEEQDPQNFTLARDGYRRYKTVIATSTTPDKPKKPNQEYININGTKKFEEPYDQYHHILTEIEVKLMQNGKEVSKQTISKSDGWQYSFKNWPKYDDNGNEYNYFVIDEVTGYAAKTNGSWLINDQPGTDGEKTYREVKKIWDDADNEFGKRPAEVKVTLQRVNYKGEVTDVATATLKEDRTNPANSWYAKFDNLDKYEKVDDIKYEYVYKFKEDPVPNYITKYNGSEIYNIYGDFDISIELGGFVWVDVKSGKETVANGTYDELYDGSESLVQGVPVKLYRADGKNFENGKKYLETVTDKYGRYKFEGLDAMSLYKVEFTYNGQYYEATTYAGPSTWGQTNWKKNSNAKENNQDRIDLNDKFAAIGAYPNNYGTNLKTYTWDQLSDKGVVDAVGNITPEALVSTDSEIKSMVKFVQDCQIGAVTDAAYPVSKLNKFFEGYEFKTYIEMISKALDSGLVVTTDQFSEFKRLREQIMKCTDRDIKQIYPDAYYINLGLHPRQTVDLKLEKDIDKVTIEINGQKEDYKYNNLSQWRCEACGKTWDESELSLELNSNFEYGFFCADQNCHSQNLSECSDMRVRLNKADDFYKPNYTRDIYPSDYEYQVGHYGTNYEFYGKSEKDELQVYVTYKITVTNQSSSIMTRVDEIVDYFDSQYEFVEDRSYIKYQQSATSEESDYVFTLKGSADVINDQNQLTNTAETLTSGTKKILMKNEKTPYQRVYITGMGKGGTAEGAYLPADGRLNIYLTFKVKKDAEGKVLLDEESDGKENIAEINGYSTKYDQGTQVPNIGDVGGKNAGLIDINSNPGNLDQNMWNEFEKWQADENRDLDKNILENDANKAPDFILELAEENDRVITGTVWEDERNIKESNALIGDGIMQENETKINGVTVQLVELMENGTEYVWSEYSSGASKTVAPIINCIVNGENIVPNHTFEGDISGTYAFKSFVPGRYVVRFIYGDKDQTVITKSLADVMGENPNDYNEKSYNGQDYKSTVYQRGLKQDADPIIINQNAIQKVDKSGNVEERDNTKWVSANIDGNDANNRLTYIWRQKNYEEAFVNGEEQLQKIVAAVPTFREDAFNNQTVQLWEPVLNSDVPGFLDSEINKTNLVNGVNPNTGEKNPQLGYVYDISESEKYDGTSEEYPNLSDAKDIEYGELGRLGRNDVNNYSSENVTNKIAEILASHKYEYYNEETKEETRELLNELEKNTAMTAETGLMVIEVEYDNPYIEKGETLNNVEDRYQIRNVNLGLVERPNAQLLLNKEVKNVKLQLANGSILFDANDTATNVLWKRHQSYEELADENAEKFKDKYGDITRINNDHILGLIQLTMDEEIMHGANIKLDYDITVKNVGEIDYKDALFYYTGKEANPSENIVTTTANEIIDYVANNLQFNAADNKEYWESISKEKLFEEELVNNRLNAEVQEFNTIIKIKDERISNELMPNLYKEKFDSNVVDSVTVPLVLSQLITSENDNDDLIYKNIAEIVKTSNTVGRRMELSVVGNQNPTEKPQEMDSDSSEEVRILPPFGETSNYILISIVTIISIGIIVVGIIFIKKKILK